MNSYVKVTTRLVIPASGSAQVELKNQNTPFEEPTIWIQASLGGNVDAIPILNEVPIVAQAINGIADATPRSIILTGTFPPNSPQAGVQNGIVPGVQIDNNTAAEAVVVINIVARSMGGVAS